VTSSGVRNRSVESDVRSVSSARNRNLWRNETNGRRTSVSSIQVSMSPILGTSTLR
jgi:hypothetical protein